MTWSVKSIEAPDVLTIWPVVAPMLEPAVALSGGRVTMRTLRKGLLARQYLLWVAYPEDRVIRAAFVTRVAIYPARKLLTVDCAGGSEMDGWLETVVQTFRAFARQSGLSGVEMFGRPGWTRALGKHGWHQTGVLCEIDAGASQR